MPSVGLLLLSQSNEVMIDDQLFRLLTDLEGNFGFLRDLIFNQFPIPVIVRGRHSPPISLFPDLVLISCYLAAMSEDGIWPILADVTSLRVLAARASDYTSGLSALSTRSVSLISQLLVTSFPFCMLVKDGRAHRSRTARLSL